MIISIPSRSTAIAKLITTPTITFTIIYLYIKNIKLQLSKIFIPACNASASHNSFHIKPAFRTSFPSLVLSKLRGQHILPPSLPVFQALKLFTINTCMPWNLTLCTEQSMTMRTLRTRHNSFLFIVHQHSRTILKRTVEFFRT